LLGLFVSTLYSVRQVHPASLKEYVAALAGAAGRASEAMAPTPVATESCFQKTIHWGNAPCSCTSPSSSTVTTIALGGR